MEKQVKEFLKGLYKLKFNYLYAGFDILEIVFLRNCTFNKSFGTANYEGSLKSDNYFAEMLIKYLKEAGYENGNYILIKQLLETEHSLKMHKSISIDGYKINLDKRRVFKDKEEIVLTTKEYDFLSYFISNKGLAISRDQVLCNVWDKNYYGSDRVFDDTLRRIRKKIPEINIQTIYFFTSYALNRTSCRASFF